MRLFFYAKKVCPQIKSVLFSGGLLNTGYLRIMLDIAAGLPQVLRFADQLRTWRCLPTKIALVLPALIGHVSAR